MTILLMLETAFATVIVCDIYNTRRRHAEYNRAYAKGRYTGYIMARNDAFYGDDRLAEVERDARGN